MIEDIVFLSVAEMRLVRPRLNTVVISVLDQSELRARPRPRLGGFRSALALDFEDSEESLGAPAWPDNPTDEEHALFCDGRGERVPTLEDALRIVRFVHGHQTSTERLHLVVHCFGGISRSAAVAEWAAVRCWAPLLSRGQRTTEGANRRLLRLLNKAAAEPPPTP